MELWNRNLPRGKVQVETIPKLGTVWRKICPRAPLIWQCTLNGWVQLGDKSVCLACSRPYVPLSVPKKEKSAHTLQKQHSQEDFRHVKPPPEWYQPEQASITINNTVNNHLGSPHARVLQPRPDAFNLILIKFFFKKNTILIPWRDVGP